jgi:hypothetical protein
LTEKAPLPELCRPQGRDPGGVKEIASGGQTLLCGVYAALPTPLGDGGQPDVASLDALIEFLLVALDQPGESLTPISLLTTDRTAPGSRARVTS